MSRRLLLGAGWLLAALCAGCVERTYTILTVPPGAIVLENGHEVGPAPLTRPFRYYGTYRFDIIANGYQTKTVLQPICHPWYEYFPLDFISENLIPWVIRDRRQFEYTLEPLQVIPPEVVLQAADQTRIQGKNTGVPLPPPVTPVPPPGHPVVPPGQPLPPPGHPAPPPGPAPGLPPAGQLQVVPLPRAP
jgi:hypothetical protein